MFEITASGRLRADPREDARMHIDGGYVPVVCAWLWCELRDAGAWVHLVAARPRTRAVLSAMRKDDTLTVSGDVLELGIHKDDGQPFIELVVCSIDLWHKPAEVEQDQEPVVH